MTSITQFVDPQQFYIFIFTKQKIKTAFKSINLKADQAVFKSQ